MPCVWHDVAKCVASIWQMYWLRIFDYSFEYPQYCIGLASEIANIYESLWQNVCVTGTCSVGSHSRLACTHFRHVLARPRHKILIFFHRKCFLHFSQNAGIMLFLTANLQMIAFAFLNILQNRLCMSICYISVNVFIICRQKLHYGYMESSIKQGASIN